MQTFPSSIIYQLSTDFGVEILLKLARNVPAKLKNGKWQMELSTYKDTSLLAVYHSALDLFTEVVRNRTK